MANRYNVLFVCTGNASRSIMAEAILSHVGEGRFAAYSAGSYPAARVHPEALLQLEKAQICVVTQQTKSWEMFAWPGAPRMDFVITLCDVASGRPQPQFSGNPKSLHWPTPDPELVDGTGEEVRRAFGAAFQLLHERIRNMVAIAAVARGREDLHKELDRAVKPTHRCEATGLWAGALAEPVSKPELKGNLIPA